MRHYRKGLQINREQYAILVLHDGIINNPSSISGVQQLLIYLEQVAGYEFKKIFIGCPHWTLYRVHSNVILAFSCVFIITLLFLSTLFKFVGL
jgi:hypothetical protein